MEGKAHREGSRMGFLSMLVVLFMMVPAPPSVAMEPAGEGPAGARAYTPRAPIKIEGSEGFTPENGVTGGSGHEDDPYVISGWEITPASSHGIEIYFVTTYLTIRNCRIKNTPAGFAGLSINFTDAIISVEHCVFEGNDVGVQLNGMYYPATISNCSFTGNRIGVRCGTSLQVQDCTFSSGTGVTLEEHPSGKIKFSTFKDQIAGVKVTGSLEKLYVMNNSFSGVQTALSMDNCKGDYNKGKWGHVTGNVFSGGTVGVSVNGSGFCSIYRNTFEDVPTGVSMSNVPSSVPVYNNDFLRGTTGIELAYCTNGTINNNNFTGASSYAVSLKGSRYNTIIDNHFKDNNAGGRQAYCDKSENTWNLSGEKEWDREKNWWNGLSSAHGNHWSDLSRPDSDRDGFVDTGYELGGGMAADMRPMSTPPPRCGNVPDGTLFCSVDADRTTGAAPLTVEFRGLVVCDDRTPYPFRYEWDFGDGATAEGFCALHTYSTPGTYTARLTVTDQDERECSATKTITPGAAPAPLEASASADKTSGEAPLTVSFTASATGGTPPYTYAWEFGDGETGAGASVSHTYAAAGTYSAVLTVTDSESQTKKAAALTITVTSGGAAPLSASASADRTSGPAPLSVRFTGVASGGTPPYTFSWSFGDGATGSGSPVSHTYTSDGIYDVVLTVTDSKSVTKTAPVITITVGGGGGSQLVVAASASPTSGPAPLRVQFTASASGGTEPYTFEWSFGDGTNGTGASVTHRYEKKGTYTVLVTVKDREGQQRSSTVTIEVKEKPKEIRSQPGLGALAVAAALATVVVLRARRRGGPDGGGGQ